jgi:hypothetical protein
VPPPPPNVFAPVPLTVPQPPPPPKNPPAMARRALSKARIAQGTGIYFNATDPCRHLGNTDVAVGAIPGYPYLPVYIAVWDCGRYYYNNYDPYTYVRWWYYWDGTQWVFFLTENFYR